MTLVAPDPAHVDCRLTASGLGRLSDVFDDIEWWRRTVRVGDTLEAIVDRIPDDTLAEPERKALARDVRAMSPLVQTVILDAFAVAIRSARGLNVTNHIVDVPGGDVTVGATDGVMVIDIGIHCAEISRGA